MAGKKEKCKSLQLPFDSPLPNPTPIAPLTEMPLVKLTVSRAEKTSHWRRITKGLGVVYFIFFLETTGSNVSGGSWLGRQQIQGFSQLAKVKHRIVSLG